MGTGLGGSVGPLVTGKPVGLVVGIFVISVGTDNGALLGTSVGGAIGDVVGLPVEGFEGRVVGVAVGDFDGFPVVGEAVGAIDGFEVEGERDGDEEGCCVRERLGLPVGSSIGVIVGLMLMSPSSSGLDKPKNFFKYESWNLLISPLSL